MIIKKCSGCGITLQTEFPENAGYVSEEKFITGTDILCQRCYRIKHYGKHQDIELTKEDYKKEVEDAVKKS